MKTTFRRLQCGILAVAWLLAGCNSDVFIDRFLSAEPSVSLSETEKEVTVCFEADNWDILGGRKSEGRGRSVGHRSGREKLQISSF